MTRGIVLTALLLIVSLPGLTAGRQLIAILDAGDRYTVVDTCTLKRPGRNPVPLYTNGFFAEAGVSDTFYFGDQIWPGEYIRVSYLFGFDRQPAHTISAPVENEAYTLPGGTSTIRFFLADGVAEAGAFPGGRALAASPNPFGPATRLSAVLDRPAFVRLTIGDAAGRRVRELVAGPRPAGPFACAWDGCDAAGRRLPAGVYLARLQAGTRTATARLVLGRD